MLGEAVLATHRGRDVGHPLGFDETTLGGVHHGQATMGMHGRQGVAGRRGPTDGVAQCG